MFFCLILLHYVDGINKVMMMMMMMKSRLGFDDMFSLFDTISGYDGQTETDILRHHSPCYAYNVAR